MCYIKEQVLAKPNGSYINEMREQMETCKSNQFEISNYHFNK